MPQYDQKKIEEIPVHSFVFLVEEHFCFETTTKIDSELVNKK